jgi:hypothetical protein
MSMLSLAAVRVTNKSWRSRQRAYKTELDLNDRQVTACRQHAGAARSRIVIMTLEPTCKTEVKEHACRGPLLAPAVYLA